MADLSDLLQPTKPAADLLYHYGSPGVLVVAALEQLGNVDATMKAWILLAAAGIVIIGKAVSNLTDKAPEKANP